MSTLLLILPFVFMAAAFASEWDNTPALSQRARWHIVKRETDLMEWEALMDKDKTLANWSCMDEDARRLCRGIYLFSWATGSEFPKSLLRYAK